jgi:hypothetical protein
MYERIVDGGHSWLKVPKAEVVAVGLQPSTYSYQDTEHYYLEEDCDAVAFIEAKGSVKETVTEVDDFPHLDNISRINI